jgi:hypothetical protein
VDNTQSSSVSGSPTRDQELEDGVAVSDGLFERLQTWLPLAVPPIPVVFAGSWSAPLRRVYARPEQYGSGSGPFSSIVDTVWSGTIECEAPVAALAFLEVERQIYWAKSVPAAFAQPFSAGLTRHADYSQDRATFSARFGGSALPGVPVEAATDLKLGGGRTTTGVPYCVCTTPGARFFVVLVQQALARTGRCRLWRLRQPAAALLPPDLQRLFTQRRSGIAVTANPRARFASP